MTSREWFRPNPPLPSIKWGPRNNTNIQQSALLFALHQVAQNKELYLENYWMKNKRSVERGKAGPAYAWLVPAAQRRKVEAADLVNSLRQQGLEIHRAGSGFKSGGVEIASGDYIIRADQPYRTLAEMYFSIQNYPPANPRPYDDTGWTIQLMRNVKLTPVTDKAILDHPMTMLTSDARVAGAIEGAGSVLVIDHTTDNTLMTFRFKNRDIEMLAAEDDFDLNGRKFRAGAFIIPDAGRSRLEPSIRELGLSAWAVAAAPQVKTHDLDVPRIGYVHAWQRTQDEGWVRAALDHYGVPYTYFADQKLRDGNLRAKYDVILFPHVGGNSQSHVNGIPKSGPDPIPYKKSDLTPNLGANDESDDIRGGMGFEGLAELAKFVLEGGTLITDGSTAAFLADCGLATGVTVERPAQLFARGAIMRGVFADSKSPIAYGFDGKELPVYFNQDPVLSAAGGPAAFGGFGGGGAGSVPGVGQNVTPNAVPVHISPWEPGSAPSAPQQSQADDTASLRQQMRAFGIIEEARPRVVMQFPANANDMLLSGTLAGGQALASRALAVDVLLGKGHIVMFALRPFWRWQTQGTYFLAFNAILNWNHLDAGKAAPERRQRTGVQP